MMTLLWLLAAATLLFQVFVSVCLLRSDAYSSSQRTLQCVLIWCLPLLGAWLSYSMIRASTYERRPDRQFTSQDDQSVAPGVHGGSGS
ncbi:hypothetical protein [Viridibacterium curvum]|uniref:Cardiolipin synthase N-terminal domain-containing protein n=1 Tax=Viridibacterium curvum TaxID=1101404 RepID=A0ABP9R7M0_9RHOO